MTDNIENENILTEQEIWDVVAFARAMIGGYGGYITPDLINIHM